MKLTSGTEARLPDNCGRNETATAADALAPRQPPFSHSISAERHFEERTRCRSWSRRARHCEHRGRTTRLQGGRAYGEQCQGLYAPAAHQRRPAYQPGRIHIGRRLFGNLR
jgi:hypothetical protein